MEAPGRVQLLSFFSCSLTLICWAVAPTRLAIVETGIFQAAAAWKFVSKGHPFTDSVITPLPPNAAVSLTPAFYYRDLVSLGLAHPLRQF